METGITNNWRILGAVFLSAVLVVGAYLLARNIELPAIARASEETALLQAIATKDSDTDGLPDWEESLYGADAHIADSFKLGMTDGEAVARGLVVPKAIADLSVAPSTPTAGVDFQSENTLTSAFARSFFSLYLIAKQLNGGAELSSDQTAVLADKAMSQFLQTFTPTADFKKATDIKTSGTGPDALRAFAVAAEAVLQKNATGATKSDLEYLQDAVQGTDKGASAHLAALAKAYRNSAVGLSVLPVPEELSAIHLVIVNSIMRLSEIYADFARVETDPLAAILALGQFRETELTAEQSFVSLAGVYASEKVVLKTGMPGAAFVNLMSNLGARHAAVKAP